MLKIKYREFAFRVTNKGASRILLSSKNKHNTVIHALESLIVGLTTSKQRTRRVASSGHSKYIVSEVGRVGVRILVQSRGWVTNKGNRDRLGAKKE